ncbi:MAG: leucine-rich repeat domain-containing protein [Spirochaetales bacterium]|nr:leucine-rich repeat domain-containing protein [Spirochaetales bacterium]
MKITELYQKIKKNLSVKVLNTLTLTLLDAKKSNNHRQLQSIHQLIFENEIPEEKDGNKLFMELVSLAHPDRLEYISGEVKKAYEKGDEKTLYFYDRVLTATESFLTVPKSSDRFNYEESESYSWDPEDFDQSFARDDWGFTDETIREEDSEFNFIRAVKAEYLGSLGFAFDLSDLSSLSGEVDLADYGIIDLDGLAYCLSVTSLNLTHNNISNIHDIMGLHNLKELYLGENQITDISYLGELIHLEILDISDNEIEDLSPLLNLTELQFINISGNPITDNLTKKELRKRGVIII